jgi:hypothetical protein
MMSGVPLNDFHELPDEPKNVQAVRQLLHRMTSHLQLINGSLELEDYTKALKKTKETLRELDALATSLMVLTDVGMTVPEDGAVAVPHGSRMVSYEDMNVDINSDEVPSVGKDEVHDGYGNDNPKTK